jgi:hypothetical protein
MCIARSDDNSRQDGSAEQLRVAQIIELDGVQSAIEH